MTTRPQKMPQKRRLPTAETLKHFMFPRPYSHTNSASPLCSMPADVLSELFEIGKKWQLESLADGENQDEVPFELLVSQLCSYTRQVALSTPRIWASINIRPSSMQERVKTYVARSASAWLNIRIDLMQDLSREDEKTLDALLAIICPQSHRWHRLSILHLFERKGHGVIRRICGCHTPALRDLSFTVEDIDHEGFSDLVSDLRSPVMFKSTRQLRFIRLSGVALHLLRPRLQSVSILHLDETKHIPLQYDKFREVVLSSPSLLHLSIYGDIVTPRSWPKKQNDISLFSLQSLRICGVSGEVYSKILLAINAPKLESLTLKQLQEHDLDALADLVDVTKFTNLKSLTFWDFDVSVYTYEEIMRVFQNVTSFSTFHSALPESHLVELLLDRSEVAGKDITPLWPTLKSLSFPLSDDDDEMEIAQALILSRKINGCPVPTVFLRASEDDMSAVESEVQGVKVVYSSRSATWPPDFEEDIQDDIFLH